MRNTPRIGMLFGALVLALTLAAPLVAAEPEMTAKSFDVKVAGGVVEVHFALALSEVSSYPVTITAIGNSVEELLYEGSLGEGVYRFSAPLEKITGRGELQVVLRTRVTNRSEKGSDSFTVYLKWRGPM